MTVLAIDFGTRRLGLAIGNSESSAALPLASINRTSLARDLKQVGTYVQSRGVTRLLVGLPLNMDGTEGPSAKAARNFAIKLSAHLGLPLDFADERLTSFEARERLSEGRGLKGGRKAAVDALAACIILEDWLAQHRDES